MKIIVNAHKCDIDKTPVNELEINITKCEFEFADEITSEFVKEAYFTLNGATYKQIIVNNECDIPSEVLEKKGTVEIGVVAKLVEGTTEIKRYNPSPAYFNTWVGSLKDAQNSEPITPSEFDQYEQALQDGLIEVNQKLVDIDQAIEDVNEAITETNNLDLDVDKQGKVATVTLTKKDASTKVVTLSDGTSLMFNWDGTKLGIKTDEDAEYTYVDLQGVQGPIGPKGEAFTIKKTYTSVAEMNADFNNMELGDYVMIASTVEVEDNAKLYTRGESQWIFISDFSGATGIRGETGLTPNIQIGTVVSGATPNVTRTGTNENPVLNFTLVRGETGPTGATGETGPTGNGIASITKTSSEGLVDTYTIAYTNGTTSTFQVTNGEDGDVTPTEFNALKDRVSDVEDNQLHDDKEGTEIYIDDAHDSKVDRLELDKESTQETTTGKNLLDMHLNSSSTAYSTFNDDGTLTINNTTSYDVTGIRIELTGLLLAGTYTFSNFLGSAIYIQSSSSDYSTSVAIGAKKTFEYDGTSYLRLAGTNVGANTTVTFKLQIESGTTATEYEEYTGGQPSPNPDYPQEVKTVKGYRNFFDKDNLENGYYNASGVKTSDNGINKITTNFIEMTSNTKISFSANQKIYGLTIFEFDVNKNWIRRTMLTRNDSKIILTIKTTTDTKYIKLGFNYDQATVITQDLIDSLELELVYGTERLPYVPYGNNYVDVKVKGKNLFDYSSLINGKSIDTNTGEIINDSNSSITPYINVKSSTGYYLSGFNSAMRVVFYDKNKNFISTFVRTNNIPFLISTPNNASYLILRGLTTYFTETTQLEQNSTYTDFEPYKETIVPIPLNGNEIAGIGNYLDELIVDKEGHVYLQKNLPKYVFTGNEGWYIATATHDGYTRFRIDKPELTPKVDLRNTNGFSNRFQLGRTDVDTVNNVLDWRANGIILLNTNVASTIAELQAYLQNNETITYYPTATPDPIDLNTTVDLKLFKYVNNISNSEDANMRIRYVQDTQLVFDKKIKSLEDRIEALEGTSL